MRARAVKAYRSNLPPSIPADLLFAMKSRRDLQELLSDWTIEGRTADSGEEWHCYNPVTGQDLFIQEWGRYPVRFEVSLGEGHTSREFPSWADTLQHLRDTLPGMGWL